MRVSGVGQEEDTGFWERTGQDVLGDLINLGATYAQQQLGPSQQPPVVRAPTAPQEASNSWLLPVAIGGGILVALLVMKNR